VKEDNRIPDIADYINGTALADTKVTKIAYGYGHDFLLSYL
jgi:hypothetical protein